jgi:hypothetical protein
MLEAYQNLNRSLLDIAAHGQQPFQAGQHQQKPLRLHAELIVV